MGIKRTIAGALLAAALIGQSGLGLALAQDAAPRNGGVDLLKGLGLPEVTITVTATNADAPATIPAGRVLLHQVNQTGAEVDTSFGQPPDGITDEQILSLGNADTLPDWFYKVELAGGANSYPPSTDAYAVVELTAGDWRMVVDRYPAKDGDPEPTDQVFHFSVTGEAAPAEAIPGAVDITAYSFGFEIPETIAAGPQIWHFRNGGSQPHFFVLFGVPAGTTADDLMQLIMLDPSSGTPIPAGGLQFEDVQQVGDAALVSPDHSEWIGEDLQPGTYALVCFMTDPASGQLHAMLGMIKLFTVA